MTNFNCPRKKKLPILVEDIKCFQCKKKYLTQNLFEWHGCFLKTRGTCIKCGLFVQKKKALLKHYVLCKGKFVTPEAARDPNGDNSIKAENITPIRGSIINISNISSLKSKGVRKKTVPQRRTTVFKAEKEINLSLANATITQQEEEEDDEYANYEEDITYDNFGSDEDEDDQTITNLEPVVQLQEPNVPRIIDIKPEAVNEFETVRQHTIETNNASLDPQLIRNIKREQANKQAVISANKHKNISEMGIKPEKAVNEQSVVQVLNPLAISKTKPSKTTATARKKVFKLPQDLASKIKREKMHSDYGDDIHEMRDEAEPDPEEEAFLDAQISPSKIKEEKLEANAIKVTSNPPKPHKQFINPLALAMMRAKKASERAENLQPSNGTGLLVISAVTSMSKTPPNGETEGEFNELLSTNNDIHVPPRNQDNNVDENTQNDKLNEINSTNESSSAEKFNPAMIQIPAEFSKSAEVDHYSPAIEKDKLDNKELSTIVASEDKKQNETVETDTDGMETQTQNANEADELDQLLQKYGGDIDDANELQDTDLQDLLKFD